MTAARWRVPGARDSECCALFPTKTRVRILWHLAPGIWYLFYDRLAGGVGNRPSSPAVGPIPETRHSPAMILERVFDELLAQASYLIGCEANAQRHRHRPQS